MDPEDDPTRPEFILYDDDDAINFVLANFLAVNRDVITFNDEGYIELAQIPALEEFKHVIKPLIEELAWIPQEHWETQDYTDEDLEFIRGLLPKSDTDRLLAIGERSDVDAQDDDADKFSIYGYLSPPNQGSAATSNTVGAVDLLLRLGVQPDVPDRWSRRLHEIFDPTPLQWRNVIVHYGYSLCDFRHEIYDRVADPYEDPEDNHLWRIERSTIHTLIQGIVFQDLYALRPLTGLIVSEAELWNLLQRNARCSDPVFLAYLILDIQDILDRHRSALHEGTLQQIDIFLRCLIRLRNANLRNTIVPQVQRRHLRQVANELADLPEAGGFMGGLNYQEAKERFERRDY
jgi:hypothetical protein